MAQPWYGWMSLGRDVDSFQQAAHEPRVVTAKDGYPSLRCKCVSADETWEDVVSDCPLDVALDQAATFGYSKGSDDGFDQGRDT